MAGEPTITVVGGFLGRDPEVRFAPSGTAICTMSVASTPRKKEGDKWIDDKENTVWFRVTQWGKEGEKTADQMKKGDKVIVTGRFSLSTFVNKENETVTVPEINADGVAVMARSEKKPEQQQTTTDDGSRW